MLIIRGRHGTLKAMHANVLYREVYEIIHVTQGEHQEKRPGLTGDKP